MRVSFPLVSFLLLVSNGVYRIDYIRPLHTHPISGYFLIRNFVFPDSKLYQSLLEYSPLSPHVAYSNRIRLSSPHASDFIRIYSSQVVTSSYCKLSDSLRIYFSTLERGLKISGFSAEFTGCVWTEAVSGKKRFQNIGICVRGF